MRGESTSLRTCTKRVRIAREKRRSPSVTEELLSTGADEAKPCGCSDDDDNRMPFQRRQKSQGRGGTAGETTIREGQQVTTRLRKAPLIENKASMLSSSAAESVNLVPIEGIPFAPLSSSMQKGLMMPGEGFFFLMLSLRTCPSRIDQKRSFEIASQRREGLDAETVARAKMCRQNTEL